LAIAHLLADSPATAQQFLRELEAALSRIAQRPAIGSPRYSYLLKGLRVWPLRRFPYLVFYLRRPSHLDVIRVLHGARDIPAALQRGHKAAR
jgi:toxin ParE1/3/4